MAVTLKLADAPEHTVLFDGGTVMLATGLTVSDALALVTGHSPPSVTITRYRYPFSPVLLLMFKVAVVALL